MVAETEAAVRQLISRGEYRAALDRAKEIHKSVRTPVSEALLVDAYVERIRALIGRGLIVEANALIELVRTRHRSARGRLDGLMTPAAAGQGSLEDLVRPLADPALPIDQRTTIERRVQQEVRDLAALAGCEALPAGHGLRTAAAALHRAFVAVTSGPVADEEFDLPDVSRRSPLAPWKMLVRAIAHFYRGETEACERCLHAIDSESAPARLAPALRAMLEHDTAAPLPPHRAGAAGALKLSPAAAALVAGVVRKPALIRELEALDRALTSRGRNGILKSIRSAVEVCGRESPGQLESLKQHISVRAAVADLEAQRVIAAMGGRSRHDATFNRLFARALEETRDAKDLVLACATWEEFRRVAAQEGWFAENGPESAMVSLHIAELLERLPTSALRDVQMSARREAKTHGRDISFLFPDDLYQRACLLDPHPDAFSRWMAWATRQGRRDVDRVAKAWHRIRPQDPEPILHLIDEAESRAAFAAAAGYLTKLERIDSLHPELQRRRFRLLAGTVIDHLCRKKLAPAMEAVERLAALPQAQQDDRPAVVAGLRAAVSVLRADAESTNACCAEIERLLESRAAAVMLLSTVAAATKQRSLGRPGRVEDLSSGERALLPLALARVGLLAGELRAALQVPASWIVEAARQFPASRETLQVDELRALADAALQAGDAGFAYAATAEGLARGGASEAGFLYLRARALTRSLERSAVCARAAAELARHDQDGELVEKALVAARLPSGTDLLSLTLEQAREVLRQEKAASAPPGPRRPEPDYRHLLPQCQCATCRRDRGEPVDPFDDFGENEDDVGLDLPPDLPPEVAEMLLDAANEAARRGESFESFASRVLGGGFPGQRPRRRPRKKKRAR